MNILENRLQVDKEIQVYEELLNKLYKERKKITKECTHDIRIANLEEKKGFQHHVELKEYCLLCGKQSPFPMKMSLPWREYIKRKNSELILMTDYPNLNKKWGTNYLKEVEKVYLNIRKRFYSYSEKEIYFELIEKLQEMDENTE